MVTTAQLESYIHAIPPLPESMQKTLAAVKKGELAIAAKHAATDPALRSYLQDVVNKPFFGFSDRLTDVGQIFGALGVLRAQQVLHGYLLHLLAPDAWEVFALEGSAFANLQAEFMVQWEKILVFKRISAADYAVAAALLPATIVVCEQMFRQHVADVALIRTVREIDYNMILERLAKKSFYDIASIIGRKWGLDERTIQLVESASGVVAPEIDPEIVELARLLHLLFFYELSRPHNIRAGLNGFCALNAEFVTPVLPDFQQVVGLEL